MWVFAFRSIALKSRLLAEIISKEILFILSSFQVLFVLHVGIFAMTKWIGFIALWQCFIWKNIRNPWTTMNVETHAL